MYGFAGYASLKKNLPDNSCILESMNSKLKKRGLDETGYYIDEYIGLSYRKLTNVEDRKNNYPMEIKYGDITYRIVYDGNIYNKKEIIKELKEKGFEITSCSDTEVLVKAFICFGTDILKRLNGVFSLAIWNDKTKTLYLARDHFGIKPLYYTILNNTIIFASEVKAIFEYPGVEKAIDKTGIAELLGIRTSSYTRNNSF